MPFCCAEICRCIFDDVKPNERYFPTEKESDEKKTREMEMSSTPKAQCAMLRYFKRPDISQAWYRRVAFCVELTHTADVND